MRRLFEFGGQRGDVDPFTAGKDESEKPQAMRSVDGGLLSRWLVPQWLRRKAISVDISTPEAEYAVGSRIPFRVTMKNELPIPIAVPTLSPVLWTWHVDGHTEASHVPLRDPPDETGRFGFQRGERKQFSGRWTSMFRVSDSEWEPAGPGEYTIGAGINVDDQTESSVYDETAVRLHPE